MYRIVLLNRWLDGQCVKFFPRLAKRLAWLDVPTKAGPSRGAVIIALLLALLTALVINLVIIWRTVA